MIANISPASSQFEETLNTLKWASRAKMIKTKVMANKQLVHLHIAEYKRIIEELRTEVEQLRKGVNMNGRVGGEGCVHCKNRNNDFRVAIEIKENIKTLFAERKELRRLNLDLEEFEIFFTDILKKDPDSIADKTQLKSIKDSMEEK